MNTTFSPRRPYFIRAIHEWLTDNELTPYLMIDVTYQGVVAPKEYAKDGKMVLNSSYSATKDLRIDNDVISFSARFGGVSQDLWLPMPAVLGIFAKEDQNQSVFFDPNEYDNYDINTTNNQSKTTTATPKKGSPFKIIK